MYPRLECTVLRSVFNIFSICAILKILTIFFISDLHKTIKVEAQMLWRDEFNIGIREIDKQHKRMTYVITDLQNALSTSNVNQQIAKTLKFLVDYTQHHFHEEKKIMQSSGYPKYDDTKKCTKI